MRKEFKHMNCVHVSRHDDPAHFNFDVETDTHIIRVILCYYCYTSMLGKLVDNKIISAFVRGRNS